MRFNIKKMLAVLLVSFLVAQSYVVLNYFFSKNGYQIIIDQECNNPGSAQIFFDVGNGYNESDSLSKNFAQGRQQITFKLRNAGVTRAIRYDPTRISDQCKLYGVKFLTAGGETLLPLADIQAGANVKTSLAGGVLTASAESNDPILSFGNVEKYNKISNGFFTQNNLSVIPKIVLFLSVFLIVINFLVEFFCREDVKKIIKSFCYTYPIKAIFIVSLLSVIFSNYPVIFFGKSFVSPVGVETISHDGSWIKNFKWDGEYENYRSSDVGAMAWAIKPNSTVAGHSVFEEHEFPFYNRYVGAGVPLYGQANNLIGDPLNFIPYIFKNIETGWDVKFILSRLIFVFGIGVLLLKLKITNLPSILITTFAASFLGYFAFRFNHPAIFCLTYAPWLLLSWINFSESINAATPSSERLTALLLLILFSWLMLNSGPIKETLIFVSYIHCMGGLFFLYYKQKESSNFRWCSLLIIYVSLALIYSPYLLTFLDALHQSYTTYDNPAVAQLNWGHLLGLFNISYSPMLLVSTNLFFLFGMVAFLKSFKSLDIKQKIFLYPALFSFLIVFGVIPAVFLVKIPFLNNIIHVWNVFSIPIMFSIIILSSIGFSKFIEGGSDCQKAIYFSFVKAYCVLFLFAALYFIPKSAFYFLFGISLLFYLIVYKYLFNQFNSVVGIKRLVVFMLFLVLPEGQHLMTNIKFIDKNVINPMPRGDESHIPDSILYIKKEVDKEPSRVIGESELMFPGFSGQFGLEGVVTVEPLRNKNFEHLLDVIGYPDKGWGWLRLIDQTQFDSLNHGLNMLGVKYVVANKGTPVPRSMQMAFNDDNDLDVWKNPTAWPRAFFTNNLKIYKTDEEFKKFLEVEPGPFVALDAKDFSQYGSFATSRQVFAAADKYHLTSNKTAFHIKVPTEGFVVISNAFYPDDFVLRVNGKQVSYFRANMAFIGCYIDKPGNYHFEIEYHPKHFKRYSLMLFVGLLIGVLAILNLGKFKSKN